MHVGYRRLSNCNRKDITGMGASMKFIDRFETRYVDFYRSFIVLVLVGTLLAGSFAFINWVVAEATDRDHQPSDYLVTPEWTALRLKVLPLSENLNDANDTEDTSFKDPDLDSNSQSKERIIVIDSRILKIAANLEKQFEGNEGSVEGFREMLPKRSLQEWLMDPSTIPSYWQDRFLTSLIQYSQELANDGRINRIRSIQGRAETLVFAIENFVQSFLNAIDTAENQVRILDDVEKAAIEEARSMLYVIAPICAYVLLSTILIIVLIRLEVHLRKIARNQ
jgi:hypothetical protein